MIHLEKNNRDLFAETTGTGWETLIFNIPELDGKNGIYNTITMILGHNISNSVEVNYYFDNIKFSSRSNTLVDLSNIDQSEEVTIYEDYQLVWNDEFNYNGRPMKKNGIYNIFPLLIQAGKIMKNNITQQD